MRTATLLLVLLLLPAVSPAGQVDSVAQSARADSTHPFPVVLKSDTLFQIRTGALGYSAQARAVSISERIRMFADELLPVDSVKTRDMEYGTEIVASGRLLLVVWDADTAASGKARSELARDLAAKITRSVQAYREDYSARGLLHGVLFSLLATVLLVLFWKVVQWLYRKSLDRLDVHVHGIRVLEKEVVEAVRIKRALVLAAKIVRAAVVIVLLSAYLEAVLSAFAWTRPFAADLFSLILSPLRLLWGGFVQQLPNLVFIAVLAVVTRYVLKGIRFLFLEMEKGRVVIPGFYPDWAKPTYNIVRLLVIAFAVVVAFPYIPGSNSAAFQGVSIFLGVLLSLGSTSAVANAVAGVILTYMRAFKVGDYIRIADSVGTVVASSLLVTRIRTPKNVDITVPNSVILANHVTNFSIQAREKKLILNTTVTIGYDAPWRQVHALLYRAAEKTVDVLKDPAPFILQQSLDDFYVTYELNAYTENAVGMLQIYSDLHKNIQDAFNEYGVQIMSPNYMADRAKPPIVPKDRWYAPPAKKPGEAGADT